MADLARLVVRLEADSLKFQKELDQAKRKLAGFDKSAKGFVSGIRNELVKIATVGAFVKLTKDAISTADNMSKAAQKIGITTESLSQLRYAADLAGVSSASLDKSLLKLNRSMSEAAVNTTSKAALAFNALGVEVENADGSLRSSDDVLNDLADQFAGMRDGATKTALAMDLLGKSGADMIPLMNGGAKAIKEARAEADAFGQTVDGKAAKAAEQFNDNMTRLSKVMTGAVLQATMALTPLMANMSDEIVKTAKDAEAMRGASESLVTGFRLLISAAILVKGTFQTVGVAIAGVAAAITEIDFAGLALRAAGPVGSLIDTLRNLQKGASVTGQSGEIMGQAFADITAQMERDGQLIDKVWSDTAASVDLAAKGTSDSSDDIAESLKGMGDAAKQAASEQASAMATIVGMVQTLQQQTDTYEQGEGAVIRYRIAQGDLAATFATAGAGADKYKAQLIALTEQLEKQKAETELAAEKQAMFAKRIAEYQQKLAETLTPMKAYEQTITFINDLLAAGVITQEQYNDAVRKAGDAFIDSESKADDWAATVSSVFENAAKSMQSSLADFLFDPFEDGLDGMLNSFVTMLRKMGAELLAAEIMKSALGAMGSMGDGGGGGIIAGIAGMFGGARANGGPVSAGTPYLVGERGPELIVPGSSGNVMNARETAGMGGTNVSMTVITPDADSFRKSRRQVVNGVKLGFGV